MLETLTVHTSEPYGDFPYEWVTATAEFAVDPAAAANARIVDLDRAPRADDGRVRFDADVRILRPKTGGNGRALLAVPNRGMALGLPCNAQPAPLSFDPTAAPAAGDAFLLRRGWTIAWCGWQWDIRREWGAVGLNAPVAEVEPGRLRVEFRPDADQAEHPLSDNVALLSFTEYPTVDVHDPDAVLTVRTSPMAAPQTVPRSAWRFTGPTTFAVDGGFRAFHIYRLIYRSAFAPVAGSGLLALRDFGAHLHGEHEFVFAHGVSQCGRLLRQMLFDGLNVDESGARVFDGMFSQIASARRGEFNQRFAQPSLTTPLTPAYGAPLDTAALLTRQRAIGGTPKIMFVNSAWEYWRGDAALLHQNPETGEDLPEDPDARAHLISGTDHIGPAPEIKKFMPLANPAHALDPALVLRALFIQLEQWVCQGREPEPSQVPRRADGTATTRERVLEQIRARFPAAALPDPQHLPWTPVIDSDSTDLPLALGDPLIALVSTVDENGNELAGIRLPDLSAGTTAYTGWNPRAHVDGLPDVLYEMLGSRLTSEPPATPDIAAIRAAARSLIDHRFLLPEDLDQAVAQATDLT
ncbi:alpha/beta hydrolase domain-containing protein [Nocardia jiangxiensis]|uniref:Alpha/beta hydrolase domain-containing protein n=1 Tax=Nocardia jiangxiensis TaxID=282685 RepID=A0ABW6RTS8_9NOCA|nr:alpha/beta hydrolase domain-containing protein [Nocardia jiangxiensis]